MSGNSNYRKSGGTNGIGASMVNALSSVFQATVNRDGKQYQLTWKDAVKQGEMTSKPFNYAHTGTTIKFAPNLKYFASAESGIIPLDFMVKLLEERSFLNYGVKTNLIYGEAKHTFYHESLAEFVPYIAKQQNDDILTKRGIIQFTDTKPTKTRTGAEGECSVQVALSFGKKTGNVVRAYTNLIEQKSGGSHVQGFKMSIGRPFIKYINDNSANYLKGKFAKLEVSAADVIDSVIAILAIEHPDPIYGSQDKSTLKNSDVQGLVMSAVSSNVTEWINSNVKSTELEAIIKRILQNAILRRSAESAKVRVTKEEEKLLKLGQAEKLADCEQSTNNEIIFCEGDSAAGSVKDARNSKNQAVMPISGKILNIQGAELKDIVGSEKIREILSAIGADVNKPIVDIQKLNYDRFILLPDADSDGI